MFMCARHWKMLPAHMQSAIWRHYRSGQEIDKQPSEAYVKVARECIDYLAELEVIGI